MAECKTQCPHCWKRYLVDESFLGEHLICEDCGRDFLSGPSRELSAQDLAELKQTQGKIDSVPLTTFMASGFPEINVPSISMSMIRVENGSFQRGSDRGFVAENPSHHVTLTRPFWIGKFQITQKQFHKIMQRSPSYCLGDDLPVENITWHEADEFCKRLTELEKAAGRLEGNACFRLPSEAEWEYACITTPGSEEKEQGNFCFGNKIEKLGDFAWFSDNSGRESHPVGEKKPNIRGIHDMHGNVGEWCWDWSAPYWSGDYTDPEGPPNGQKKVRRGGSWASIPERCRAFDRVSLSPDCRSALVGFRIILIGG